MRHGSIERAPWRFLEERVDGIEVEAGQVRFDYAGTAPSLYAPGHVAISIYRNLATIADDESRLSLVAASLGPLFTDRFESGHAESLADWLSAAELMRECAWMVDGGKFDPLAKVLTDRINGHGDLIALGDRPAWNWNYSDLIGASLYEVAEDLFSAIKGKAPTYIECGACTRVLRRVRKDQLFCSRACTSKGHRVRIETGRAGASGSAPTVTKE